MITIKPVSALTTSDFRVTPVWEYVNDDQDDEINVFPVIELPATHLDCRIIGVEVRLYNGSQVWAMLGIVDCSNPRATEHFLSMSITNGEGWFSLARYHDLEPNSSNPIALAAYLGLPIDEVFPISYDISRFAFGDRDSLIGLVRKEPVERLTTQQLVTLAIP